MYQKSNLQLKTFLIIGFLLIAYMLFNLAISVYKDYQVNLRLKKYATENAKIASDNALKSEEYRYFNSNLFKDKYAKENLNKLQPGEKMLILPEKTESFFAETPLIEKKEDQVNKLILLPNKTQWKEYFFGETGT